MNGRIKFQPLTIDPVSQQQQSSLGNALRTGRGISADRLGGLSSADILNRANGTGPVYAHFMFPLATSGMVLRGRYRGGLYRFYPLDTDPDNLMPATEPVGALEAGDKVFEDSLSGPVMYGRFKGGLYRWLVLDDDADAPQLGIEKIAGVRPTDLHFGHVGFGFVNRGRTGGRWVSWYVNDRDGGDWLNDYPAVEYWSI